MFEHLEDVPVVCIIAVDLKVVASMDQFLDRVGVVSGASIYPMAWSALMAARNEGFGGTLTTLLAAQEPAVQQLLGLESHEAVSAMLTIGRPPKQLSKLSRKPVEEFVSSTMQREGRLQLEFPDPQILGGAQCLLEVTGLLINGFIRQRWFRLIGYRRLMRSALGDG